MTRTWLGTRVAGSIGGKALLFLTLGLAFGLTLLVSLTVSDGPVQAQGACDRWVLGIDGSDATDCSDEVHPCATVQ